MFFPYVFISRVALISILLTTLFASYVVPHAAASTVAELDDKAPLVTINGVAITKGDHQRAVDATLKRLRARGVNGDDLDNTFKSQILQQMVRDELIYQDSQRLPREKVTEKVDEIWMKFRNRFADEAAYQTALDAAGIDEQHLREKFTRQASKVIYIETEIIPNIKITDALVRAAYKENAAELVAPEQVRAAHILLKVEEEATDSERDAARKQAEEIRNKVLDGEDFAQLAQAHSACTSASTGGELGWLSRDQRTKPFTDAAFATPPGGLSEVVKTALGYHVIRVDEHRAARPFEFSEVEKNLRAQLQGLLTEEALSRRTASLQLKAKIKVGAPHNQQESTD